MTPLDVILAETLPAGVAVARLVRERLLAVAAAHPFGGGRAVRAARQELRAILPVFAAAVRDALLSAWLSAAAATAGDALDPDDAPDQPEPVHLEPAAGPVRLPVIETATAFLRDRQAVTDAQFRALSADAQRTAIAISHAAATDAADRFKAALEESARDGGTLAEFRVAVADAADASQMSEAHVENVYRTNLGRAYAAGQQAVLAHPLVEDEFPYVLYSATHDGRVDPDHLSMESRGLDGTAVYRADDPTIRKFWPPFRWNCRCSCFPISLADAASYGVKEAIAWLESGDPPARPQWVQPPPFDLPPGWVPHDAGRLSPAV